MGVDLLNVSSSMYLRKCCDFHHRIDFASPSLLFLFDMFYYLYSCLYKISLLKVWLNGEYPNYFCSTNPDFSTIH